MAYVYCNPNPCNNLVIDCVIRAISIAMDREWRDTYLDICIQGYIMCDMPSSNRVWKAYLLKHGFKMDNLPNICPECYTVRDFCVDHPYGIYILCTGEHAVTVIDGNYYDTWDSGDVVPLYYFYKER